MAVYLVTGTTRGLGRSLVRPILDQGHHLYSLSSAPDHSLERWQNLQCDLSRSDEVNHRLARIIDTIAAHAPDTLVLINNAAVLAPIGPLDEADTQQILAHVQVNQAAPAVLMAGFMRLTDTFASKRRIINISSGAARYPYAGWAMYCASKAALDMLTRCTAAEQAHRANPVLISALYPGKVDTGMQRQIRGSDAAKFPEHARFVRAKQNGELLSPDHVARLILALDEHEQLSNGGLYDLRAARIGPDGSVTGHRIIEPGL